jgi:5-methylcytosine-specific restriction enzyme subunit McrC
VDKPITVREYALLGTAMPGENTLDRAQISESAFDWLCTESTRLARSGARLALVEGRTWLRLDNYVGVLQTPCGTRIEVLPKTSDAGDCADATRDLLQRMLRRCLDLPVRTSAPTDLRTFNLPVNEWVMHEFLVALSRLVQIGLRFRYRPVCEQQRFLRSRLEVHKQARQPPGRQHLFCIEHDVFDADRPENRLLVSALARVRRLTRDPGNWRRAQELASLLATIPPSANVAQDFKAWQTDRLLAHYRPVRPWCALILNEQSPLSVVGDWHGESLLFPMERVFERYVESCLRDTLPLDVKLKRQAATKYLCQHRSEGWFQLRPDFLVQRGSRTWVMDTKWKRIDGEDSTRSNKYGLSQADFYQMFAYGHRYLEGVGEMFLVYPSTAELKVPLEPFDCGGQVHLNVIPFDLERGRLLGAPACWMESLVQEPRQGLWAVSAKLLEPEAV